MRSAAHAGLTDSVPRAAVLSLHARLDGVGPDVLERDDLVQVWGPRYSVYVVAEADAAVFTLGRLPRSGKQLERALGVADRIAGAVPPGEERPMGDVGRELGIHPGALRYAAPTGRLRIRWDGARQPTVRIVAAPSVDADEARRELARRFLRCLGPGTADAFGAWAGIRARPAAQLVDELAAELAPVETPIGDAWILADEESAWRAEPLPTTGVRLLPSGDSFWLTWGDGRRLLVDDPRRRDELWTSRVWPGALSIDGEIVGTWRRAGETATLDPWRRLSTAERSAVEAEVASMPLPDLPSPVRTVWSA